MQKSLYKKQYYCSICKYPKGQPSALQRKNLAKDPAANFVGGKQNAEVPWADLSAAGPKGEVGSIGSRV